jgi:twinkle protein
MKQKDSTTWQLDSTDELRPRCKDSDKGKKKYRFHCPLCGDETKHKKRTDGAFDEEKGVGHCFCCGANFFASKWTYQPQRRQMPRQPEISLGAYPSSIMAYLKERGLKPEVMHRLGVGWAELPADTPDGKKTFLAFRFLEHGLVFNVQYKSPDKEFRFEKDCRIAPYNIDAVLGAETVYITEGMMDAAVLVQCGYESVISLPNGCGTRMACFDPYREHFRGVKIVYAGDTDPKGVEKRLEVAKYFADNEFRYVEWAEGKDANDMLMAGGEDMVRFCIEENSREVPPQGVITVVDQMEQLNELIMNGVPRFPGINLHGFSHFVRFEPGRLMVISGFPGAGKSSFADYVMMSLAVQQDWKAAVYSPEKYPMSLHYYELGQLLMGREMSRKNFPPQAIERGLRFLRQNIFHISEECTSIEDIIATATQLVHQKGIRTLLIDPFNYIELPVLTGANDTQKISHVLRQIVDFAHQYKVLVILVAHPKKPQTDGGRKGEPLMPSLYDIAGSADFYNKCDYGLILQRQRSDEYTKGTTLTWIHVLKIRFRHLGQIGKRAFGFDTTCGRFVGTQNDSLTLCEYDRSDWSSRAPEQQQLAFEAPNPEDDMPF